MHIRCNTCRKVFKPKSDEQFLQITCNECITKKEKENEQKLQSKHGIRRF